MEKESIEKQEEPVRRRRKNRRKSRQPLARVLNSFCFLLFCLFLFCSLLSCQGFSPRRSSRHVIFALALYWEYRNERSTQSGGEENLYNILPRFFQCTNLSRNCSFHYDSNIANPILVPSMDSSNRIQTEYYINSRFSSCLCILVWYPRESHFYISTIMHCIQ